MIGRVSTPSTSANLTRILGSLDSQPRSSESRTFTRLFRMSWEILGQSAMPSAPTDYQLPATVMPIVTRMSMDCQPLSYCHADCHLDVSAPKSANVAAVSAAFKVGIPCLVLFNGAYSVHPNEPLVVVIHQELMRLTGEDGLLTSSLWSIANFTAVSTTF
jgi:hypothetical protein